MMSLVKARTPILKPHGIRCSFGQLWLPGLHGRGILDSNPRGGHVHGVLADDGPRAGVVVSMPADSTGVDGPRRRRVCRHPVAVVTRSRHKSLEMSLLWQAVYCSFVAETFLCILLMVISYLPIFIRR